MTAIKFIPPQTGPITAYTVRALRSGPLWLLIKDAGVLLTALPYLPLLFLPLNLKRGGGAKQSQSLRLRSMRDVAIQALLLIIELILSILFLPALISLPGLLFIGVTALSILIIRLIAYPTQGPRIVESSMDQETQRLSQRHPKERWIFINGIFTGSTGLQQNINHLSLLFGRKVTGIHNESYGFLSDLVECLLQRCLSYNTTDVRIACEVVRDRLVDPEVEKVVLIGYSQGGIIASMVVDYLLVELSAEMMGKLEIYTFGSAASHFHNPPTNNTNLLLPCSSSTTTESSPCTIPHIEHYANEYDMVPRWGVLYATNTLLTNRYAGEVFVRTGASGHMLVDHYLDPIFPLAEEHQEGDQMKAGKKGVGRAMVNGNGHRIEEADSYLGAIVNVDTDVETKRRSIERDPFVSGKSKNVAAEANGYPGPMVNGKSKKAAAQVNGHPASSMVNGSAIGGAYGTINSMASDEHMVDAVPARGKTVKELSRLWKYLGGATPED